ncbi:MAG: APC family permease [Kineosporiaceae bacterium]
MAAALAADRLGLWPVFFFAVSAMTPLTVVAGAVPIGYGQIRETSIPVAYASMAAVMAVFAVGFVAMARRIPNAGAFYTYVARGLSRPLGVGAAGVALAAYNAIQIALYGGFGFAAGGVMASLGVQAHWGVWAAGAWVAVAWLGLLRVDLNARILGVLVLAEIGVVLVFDVVLLAHPADGVVRFDTLDPTALATAGGAAVLVGAIAGFVGAEAPVVYTEEARDPQRTIGRAVYLTLAVACVLYAGSAWAMSVATGPDRIVDEAARHGTDLFFVLPAPHLPDSVIAVAAVLFVTSLFAAMLAFHHTIARYVFALARERVLPASMARTNRAGAPVVGSLTQTATAAVVLAGCLWAGVDPVSGLLFVASVVGGLGILLLLTFTSIAVLAWFHRHPDGESRWRRLVAPTVASLALTMVSLATVAFFGDLLGVTHPALAHAAPAAYLAILTTGVLWGLHLRARRPHVYQRIGLGPHATHTHRPPTGTPPGGRHRRTTPTRPSHTPPSATGRTP